MPRSVSTIERDQLAQKDRRRPGIKSNVVNGDKEGMLVRGKPEKLHPERRFFLQIKRSCHLGGGSGHDRRFREGGCYGKRTLKLIFDNCRGGAVTAFKAGA